MYDGGGSIESLSYWEMFPGLCVVSVRFWRRLSILSSASLHLGNGPPVSMAIGSTRLLTETFAQRSSSG